MTGQFDSQEQLRQVKPEARNGNGRFGVVFRRLRDVLDDVWHRDEKEVVGEVPGDEDAWVSERTDEIWRLVEQRFEEDPRLEFVGGDFRQVREWILGEKGEAGGMVFVGRGVSIYDTDLSYRPKFYQECQDRNGLEFSQRFELYKDVWDTVDPGGEWVDVNYARKRDVGDEWLETIKKVLDGVEKRLVEHENVEARWIKPIVRPETVENVGGEVRMVPLRKALRRQRSNGMVAAEFMNVSQQRLLVHLLQ